MKFVYDAVAGRTGTVGRILDVGCGDGGDAAVFASACDSVVGIDISPSSSWKSQPALFTGASVQALPFRDETFDIVFANSVFQYVDRRRALVECARVLRPGGALMAIENLRGSPAARIARRWLSATNAYGPGTRPLQHLRRQDVGLYREAFRSVRWVTANVTTTIPFALQYALRIPDSAPGLDAIYSGCHRLDGFGLRAFPPIEEFAWHIAICAER